MFSRIIAAVTNSVADKENSKVIPWKKASEVEPHLRKGDLIEFLRGAYRHWAVFIGFEKGVAWVIHYSGEGNDVQSMINASVCRDKLSAILEGSKIRINNSENAEKRPFEADEIVSRAESRLGEKGYNIYMNNCEHFAKWCRYGTHQSQQSNFVKVIVDSEDSDELGQVVGEHIKKLL